MKQIITLIGLILAVNSANAQNTTSNHTGDIFITNGSASGTVCVAGPAGCIVHRDMVVLFGDKLQLIRHLDDCETARNLLVKSIDVTLAKCFPE